MTRRSRSLQVDSVVGQKRSGGGNTYQYALPNRLYKSSDLALHRTASIQMPILDALDDGLISVYKSSVATVAGEGWRWIPLLPRSISSPAAAYPTKTNTLSSRYLWNRSRRRWKVGRKNLEVTTSFTSSASGDSFDIGQGHSPGSHTLTLEVRQGLNSGEFTSCFAFVPALMLPAA